MSAVTARWRAAVLALAPKFFDQTAAQVGCAAWHFIRVINDSRKLCRRELPKRRLVDRPSLAIGRSFRERQKMIRAFVVFGNVSMD
jgi:hypothetical protein